MRGALPHLVGQTRAMRVVVAMDSFKGSLDSRAAGDAVAEGVRRADPGGQVQVIEIADGGEGTLSALMRATGGKLVSVESVDAVCRPIVAEYGVFERDGRRVALIESARTIGIGLVDVDDGLPPRASSLGLGRQLVDALDRGVDEILIGLGGSATTDGGTGLLLALGARLLDAEGGVLDAGENPLWRVHGLDVTELTPLGGTQLTALTDVSNPLHGRQGAAVVFGPQKGATADQVAHLDGQLRVWADLLAEQLGRDVAGRPGAGAAGGLGAALLALGGTLEPGFDRVAAEARLPEALAGADLVLTGEGSLDAQSAHGKVPYGVARLAADAGASSVALAGRLEAREDPGPLDGAFGIHSRPRSAAEAMDPATTRDELSRSAFEVTRLVAHVAARARSGGPARR